MRDPHEIETREDREAREAAETLARLKTLDGQADEFRDAVNQALNMVNRELTAQDVLPYIGAVIEALTILLAEFVAMDPVRDTRRKRMAEIEANLKMLVASLGTTGAKPGPLLPEELN